MTAVVASGGPDVDAEAQTGPGSEAPSKRGEKRGKRTSTDIDLAIDPTALAALSDEELLEGIRAKSEPHFEELYRRYFQRIYSFVHARMRNHAETEEVVQETFLAVFRSFDRYRGQSSLLSWIYGIAKNTANNSIRRARSQHERIDLADEEDLIPRPSLEPSSPSEQLDLNRFQALLRERLAGLADWQTEIFELRHFENLSIPEISRRTTRSSDAVRSSLYRVKRIFYEVATATGGGSLLAGERS
ncbi:MAG TPA: RNA polymerase sigma factor [Deltaproteobacteria bacterium]|nr:RNA polymerase sigma factor [Deltaproteobacteria bacterium]